MIFKRIKHLIYIYISLQGKTVCNKAFFLHKMIIKQNTDIDNYLIYSKLLETTDQDIRNNIIFFSDMPDSKIRYLQQQAPFFFCFFFFFFCFCFFVVVFFCFFSVFVWGGGGCVLFFWGFFFVLFFCCCFHFMDKS